MARSFLRCGLSWLPALAMATLAFSRPALAAEGAAAAATPFVSVGMPSDFAKLAAKQTFVVDMLFGGRPIGQFEIETTPGTVRILHPDRVVAALPGLADPAAVTAALSAPA